MKRGFTLVEMLVSVAIFSVVMVMALGALLSLSVADRRAQALKSTMDNLNFAIDSMSRSMRTSSLYHCDATTGTITSPRDCSPTGATSISFLANNGSQVYYQLDTNPGNCGQTGTTGGCIERRVVTSLGADSGYLPITAPEVVITGLMFYVTGSPSSPDKAQPTVVLTLSGYAQITATQQSTFHLQTVATQRIYDQ